MEQKTELKPIKLTLIALLFVSIGSFVILEVVYSSEPAKNIDLGTELAFSGFGEVTLFNPQKANLFSSNIYQDTQLGYQISKPNNDWEIHSALDDLSSNELSSLKTKGFLDGIYVEKNHDKRFMLTVFDIQKENFSLLEYVDDQIALMESQKNTKIPFVQLSPQNDWGIFAVESSDEKEPYGEQLLFFKDNRLYMLQYYGDSPQILTSDQKSDFQFIMDSFEVI